MDPIIITGLVVLGIMSFNSFSSNPIEKKHEYNAPKVQSRLTGQTAQAEQPTIAEEPQELPQTSEGTPPVSIIDSPEATDGGLVGDVLAPVEDVGELPVLDDALGGDEPIFPVDQDDIDDSPSPPVVEEPVFEEPVVDEPVFEEPVIDEPVFEEPVLEEPITETPIETPIETPVEVPAPEQIL